MSVSKAFNLEFKMFMEGVEVPFRSASIVCTPNGVEASINIYANRWVYDIKPKTAVQIFFKDFAGQKTAGWRLMFDGFLSSYYKVDDANQGRQVSIVCRDFRADIRRAPAAIAYNGETELSSQRYFTMQGLFPSIIVSNVSVASQDNKISSIRTRQYNNDLNPLWYVLKLIAGTAAGKMTIPSVKPGQHIFQSGFGDTPKDDERGRAKCAFFLDAIVRGLWTEAVGGTTVGMFINKRCRVDKRFLIPRNRVGYNFWSRQSAGINIGSYILGNSRFSSLEAAIMRIAGLFSVRVYSCNTPSLIYIGEDSSGNPNPALQFIMDEDVRKFLVKDNEKYFGAPYILNESMLLPPLEFTAPPNCNIFLPPVYDKVVWQFDIDSDATRGHYDQIPTIPGSGSPELTLYQIQVPNALFNYDNTQNRKGDKDKFGRIKPPMTLEERYKGINVSYGSVSQRISSDDAASSAKFVFYNAAQRKIALDAHNAIDSAHEANRVAQGERNDVIRQQVVEQNVRDRGEFSAQYGAASVVVQKTIAEQIAISNAASDKLAAEAIDKAQKAAADASQKLRSQYSGNASSSDTMYMMKRHALIKFLNSKYAGRVVTVDMQFNPYPMCGFPGMVVDDEFAGGDQASKSVIGMVQQVKHSIYISSEGADASTSVVLNNSRFVDEPTDMDADGNPIYMKATEPGDAEINPVNLWYLNEYDTYKDVKKPKGAPPPLIPPYIPPDAKAEVRQKMDSKYYDLTAEVGFDDYVYAKDLLTLTESQVKFRRESNSMYIDPEYEPQKIVRIYRDVFKHSKDSFMIGRFIKNKATGETAPFVYDSIHEATVMLRTNNKALLYDFAEAMSFCSRTICSADAFFQGILGLSVKSVVTEADQKAGRFLTHNVGDTIFVCNERGFDDTMIEKRYYGVSTKKWNSGDIDGLKDTRVAGIEPMGPPNPNVVEPGLMKSIGSFSSINETMPVTAFIQERRDSVEKYIVEATKMAQGMSFTEP